MFRKLSPPSITMGGLYQFEKALRVSAPSFIERLVVSGSESPDVALDGETVQLLVKLVSFCGDGVRVGPKWAKRLVLFSPTLVADSLRDFLVDPLPVEREGSGGDGSDVELPSVLDMRSAWLAGGGDPLVFDDLKLWEHSRILRQQEKRQRAALADAAVAARVAKAADDKYRRFISEMLDDQRAYALKDALTSLVLGRLPGAVAQLLYQIAVAERQASVPKEQRDVLRSIRWHPIRSPIASTCNGYPLMII